jgi:tRNA A58 N-methylase Trm61
MFELFREERAVFTFDDYAAVMGAVRGMKRIMEFGPGASTLAMIEAGVEHIVSAECDPKWEAAASERLREYIDAKRVEIVRFTNTVPVTFSPEVEGPFDLVFVDSPVGIEARSAVRHIGQTNCSRLNTMMAAIELAPVVLLHDAKRRGEQATLERVAALGHKVTMLECVKGLARVDRC